MPSGPLLAALAARALDHQEAPRSRRRRRRRLAVRVGQLTARQAPKAPVGADVRRRERDVRSASTSRRPRHRDPVQS